MTKAYKDYTITPRQNCDGWFNIFKGNTSMGFATDEQSARQAIWIDLGKPDYQITDEMMEVIKP